MKKTRRAVISVLSLIILLTFIGSAFAQDVCVIKWWGDEEGLAPTNETSRTQQAAEEAFLQIIDSSVSFDNAAWTEDCFRYDYSYALRFDWEETRSVVCLDGSWSDYHDCSDACSYRRDLSGNWDVFCGLDSDSDGIPDSEDNCPSVANPGQEDCNSDGDGDACDIDTDSDEIPDDCDNCPSVANPGQEDMDGDNTGDVCDIDRDGDTVLNENDNCPDTPNPDQGDGDIDGIGDVCDPDSACIIKWWGDKDGWASTSETIKTEQATFEAFVLIHDKNPFWSNDCWELQEEFPDGYNDCGELTKLDEYETCIGGTWSFGAAQIGLSPSSFCRYPYISFIESYSGEWDVFCGPDRDVDGVPDSDDGCPNVANAGQEDIDADGTGDVCDADTVYGTVTGAVQADVTVGIYKPNCGGDVLLDATTTDSEGYYAFGNLLDGWHTIVPELSGYTFAPGEDYPKMPQAEIKSYDFTATVD